MPALPRPPPRPFALIPTRFCDCVPATTCGRPATLVVARIQIGLSHTSWIANSESVNCRPSSSINAYRMRAHDSLPNKSQSIFEAVGAFLSESEKSTDFEFRSGLLPSSPRPQYLLSTICGAPTEAGTVATSTASSGSAGCGMVVVVIVGGGVSVLLAVASRRDMNPFVLAPMTAPGFPWLSSIPITNAPPSALSDARSLASPVFAPVGLNLGFCGPR